MHITQRGVNRGAVFIDDEDRLHYLDLLAVALADSSVALHAYALMGNHAKRCEGMPRAAKSSADSWRC